MARRARRKNPRKRRLITVQAAAERLRVSPRTIYNYFHMGHLEGTKPVGAIRIYADSVEKLIRRGELNI